MYVRALRCAALLSLCLAWISHADPIQGPAGAENLDTRVRGFLDSRRSSWRDMNVPEADGKALHDIILEHGYKRALEIGTSTGHSGIWIAWALSKTGGKLTTIDIDPGRHQEAVANFKAAGLANLIDARLGDAHEIVPALPGPYDFVFSDADKDWYINYLKAVLPKLVVGGTFVSHNVSEGSRGYGGDYLQFVRSLPYMETSLFSGGGGMAISCKKADK